MLVAFNKPYGVLSQFTPDGSSNAPLAQFGFPKGIYPIGRLDADSEGLLLLSDEPALNEKLLHPRHAHEREYWAQVERIPSPEALARLEEGATIRVPARVGCRRSSLSLGERTGVRASVTQITRPSRIWFLDPQPELPPRIPPIRFRKTVPTCWIGLELTEGKNRQVRRMTAAIGHPTLRLIRVRIGNFLLSTLPVGQWKPLSPNERKSVLSA